MADLSGQAGEIKMTVHITRKETGRVEEYQLVGKVTGEQLEELNNACDPHDSGTECRD